MRSNKPSIFTSLAIYFFIAFASAYGYSQGSRLQHEPYRIVPGDVLEIFIEDAPELDGYYAVKSNGRFLMHFLKCVIASGKTTDEMEAFLAEQLRGRYLKDPKVHVAIMKLPQGSIIRQVKDVADVSIYGAVNVPGDFSFQEGMTIRDALIKVRGVTSNAQDIGYIIRYPPDDCKETKIPFNVNEVIKDDKGNLQLLPGDELFIPAQLTPNRQIIKPLRPSPRLLPWPTKPAPMVPQRPKTGPLGSVNARNHMHDKSFDERERGRPGV